MHSRILIILISLIFVLLTILFGIRYYQNTRCLYTDKKICAFTKNLYRETFSSVSGTNILSNKSNIEQQFKFNNKKGSLVISSNTKPLIDIIETDEYVYLKKSSESTWYRQTAIHAESYSYKRPSSMRDYLFELKKWFLKSAGKFKYVKKTICNDEVCYEYQVKGDNFESSLYIDEGGKLSRFIVKYPTYTETLTLNYVKTSIEEPSEYTQKGNENIFLLILKEVDNSTPYYQYLQEFEIQRQQSEGNK